MTDGTWEKEPVAVPEPDRIHHVLVYAADGSVSYYEDGVLVAYKPPRGEESKEPPT